MFRHLTTRLTTTSFCLLLAGTVFAQENNQPFLEFDMPETTTLPGQALDLRLTVLVPTFMPRPVEFPSFDYPNLRIILPERATQPISRRIDGQLWSGVSRHYLVVPLVAGNFSIPPQQAEVTYSSPEDRSAVTLSLQSPAIQFRVTVPDTAAGLDPFIAANGLELEQALEGDPGVLTPGDSLRWTVTASINGNSPMVLPPLLPVIDDTGISLYPDAPAVEEQWQDNTLSGSRQESLVLMAEGNTSRDIPAISLQWYNLETGEIETASTDPFHLNITGATPGLQERIRSIQGWRAALLALATLLLLWLLWHYLHRPLFNALKHLHQRHLDSEAWAFRQLERAIRKRNLPATLQTLELWQSRWAGPSPRQQADIEDALQRLGRAQYGNGIPDNSAWSGLQQGLTQLRSTRAKQQHSRHSRLTPLNPS